MDRAIRGQLSSYETLISVLQIQVSYLATLSMTLKDESSSKIFVEVVSAIFSELQDGRLRSLFILLLQLMTLKELEQVGPRA